MIDYLDGVTELNSANACNAGPSTKSIDMIASIAVITQPLIRLNIQRLLGLTLDCMHVALLLVMT